MKDQNDNFDQQPEMADRPQSTGRRSLLKGTVAAMPAILTLQSGAALARSSNLIGAAHPSTRYRDKALCLNTDRLDPVWHEKYDLGPRPNADVTVIKDLRYFSEPDRSSAEVDESEICAGTKAYYKRRRRGEWMTAETRGRGIIVSATALRSFAGHINFTEL